MSSPEATDNARRRGRRERVIDVLVRHGLTARAAEILYRLGLSLRRRMLQGPDPRQWTECAGMIESHTGQRLGPVATGDHRSVDVGLQLHAARGRHAANVHTHPGNSSFSPDDVTFPTM